MERENIKVNIMTVEKPNLMRCEFTQEYKERAFHSDRVFREKTERLSHIHNCDDCNVECEFKTHTPNFMYKEYTTKAEVLQEHDPKCLVAKKFVEFVLEKYPMPELNSVLSREATEICEKEGQLIQIDYDWDNRPLARCAITEQNKKEFEEFFAQFKHQNGQKLKS